MPASAVMLRYFEDMTEPEIAAVLGVSLGMVKSTVSRLRIDVETRQGFRLCRELQFMGYSAQFAGPRGLLPGAWLMALSGMQVRHLEEVARCGAP